MDFIRAGFRTVRQNPAILFAEIAWRWTFGLAAWLLVIFTLRTIMEGIDVSGAEIALARSNNAYLIADAVIRLLVQVMPRFLAAMVLVIPALAILWTLAATIGRAATLDTLLAAPMVVPPAQDTLAAGAGPARTTSVLRLFLLTSVRAMFTLATGLAFLGTVFLISAQAPPHPQPQIAPLYLLAWMFLALLVGVLWGVVNWFLALAAIFVARDGVGVGKALSTSVGLYRDHRGEYASIASWFGFFRGAALVAAVFAGIVAAAASLRAGLIASAFIALLYFAVADWLYIARLAAYVRLAQSPSAGVTAVLSPDALAPEPVIAEIPPPAETETESRF